MYKIDQEFGGHVHGRTIGECWLDLVRTVNKFGNVCYDEGRKRKALYNVRLKSKTQLLPDKIICNFADKDKIQAMIKLTFAEDKMYDIDKTPSFNNGAKSYHKRIKEGKLIDFVVSRLTRIPESKKAVIVFPTYEDYVAVIKNPKNDYLPCLVSLQFRLIKQNGKFTLNTNFYFRSIDVFQKAPGNLITICMLSKIVAEKISKKMFRRSDNIQLGYLDGLIADAHIYANTNNEIENLLRLAKNE